MANIFIGVKDLGGFREVLEFAMVPFWPKDVELLANGKGRIMLEVCREKKLIERLPNGLCLSATGYRWVEQFQREDPNSIFPFSEVQALMVSS